MAKPLESINEAMGGTEDHLAVWRTRLNAAAGELKSAQGKPEPVKSGAVKTAQVQLDKVRAEYAKFLENNP